jgi:hypothetical protein
MVTLRKNMSEHSFTTMCKMYNMIIKYVKIYVGFVADIDIKILGVPPPPHPPRGQ